MTQFADTRLARMLEQGRLTVTVKSLKTGEHISLKFAAKAKVDGSWKSVPFVDASHVFVNKASDWTYRVGTYRPDVAVFSPANHVDAAFVFAATQVLDAAFGTPTHPLAEITESDNCGRCSRQLTDPESIARGIGPECLGKITGSKHYVSPDAPVPAVAASPEQLMLESIEAEEARLVHKAAFAALEAEQEKQAFLNDPH